MFERDTLKKLAAEETKIQEWLKLRKDEFYEALGLWPGDDDTMVLVLAKLCKFFDGQWSGYKDDIDRAGCDALSPFLRKQEVDQEELRSAVALLVQRFNAACERIHQLESRPRPQPRPNPPRPPYLPRKIR
jgi:hypothetical protein